MNVVYTAEQKNRAGEADLVDLLRSCGQEVKRVGSEYEWKDGDQTVSIKDNLWFHQYEQVGGNTIHFVQKFMGMSFPEAVGFILGETEMISPRELQKKPREEKHPRKPFVLPDRNDNMRRVFAYLLNQRGINADVLRIFAHAKLIYESKDYHNVVFVGTDKTGTPRHAHKRSTASSGKWRANQAGSDARFSFNWRGNSDKVFLFEAPIDMLSYITMHPYNWHENTFVASCSLSEQPLIQMLKDNPTLKNVFICFDNDPPGQQSAKFLHEKLYTSGYKSEILVPSAKDWNEDLLNFVQEEGEALCPKVSLLL